MKASACSVLSTVERWRLPMIYLRMMKDQALSERDAEIWANKPNSKKSSEKSENVCPCGGEEDVPVAAHRPEVAPQYIDM
jgi:hypothetical protein